MSEVRRVAGAVLVFLVSASLLAAPDAPDANQLLARADRVKNAWDDALVKLRVTTVKPGAKPVSGTFEVAVKGGTKSRIRFLNESDKGKAVVSNGDDAWLLLPTAKNPIKIPKSHRLEGGFSAADMSRTRFAENYDAVVERSDVLNGLECRVLRLTAKKGQSPSYPIVRLWIDRKDGLYRKGIFLLASGKTAKETAFDEYKPFHGIQSLAKMTIVDALRPGTTVVEYLDYEKRQFPDAVFDLTMARTAEP